MGIWIAIAIGSALARVTCRSGDVLLARLDAGLAAPYQRLRDQRVDCFVLGLLAGSFSTAADGMMEGLTTAAWAGLLCGFAVVSGLDSQIPAPGSRVYRSGLARTLRLVLAPVAAVAGWLCADTIGRAML